MNTDELEKLMSAAAEKAGYEITDVRISAQRGKPLLQFFIDRLGSDSADANGGITLDDCGLLSDILGKALDAGGYYADGYCLEISSPGTDRVLKTERDFNRFAGAPVKIRLKTPREGTRVFYGNIDVAEKGILKLAGNLNFNLTDIDEVRLHYSDDEILRRKE